MRLVEAGIDLSFLAFLSFPMVYRAEAGLDSMVQAAGQCNRKSKLAALRTTYQGPGARTTVLYDAPAGKPRGIKSEREPTSQRCEDWSARSFVPLVELVERSYF